MRSELWPPVLPPPPPPAEAWPPPPPPPAAPAAAAAAPAAPPGALGRARDKTRAGCRGAAGLGVGRAAAVGATLDARERVRGALGVGSVGAGGAAGIGDGGSSWVRSWAVGDMAAAGGGVGVALGGVAGADARADAIRAAARGAGRVAAGRGRRARASAGRAEAVVGRCAGCAVAVWGGGGGVAAGRGRTPRTLPMRCATLGLGVRVDAVGAGADAALRCGRRASVAVARCGGAGRGMIIAGARLRCWRVGRGARGLGATSAGRARVIRTGAGLVS